MGVGSNKGVSVAQIRRVAGLVDELAREMKLWQEGGWSVKEEQARKVERWSFRLHQEALEAMIQTQRKERKARVG